MKGKLDFSLSNNLLYFIFFLNWVPVMLKKLKLNGSMKIYKTF